MIDPIIVDPASFDKHEMFERAKLLVHEFLDSNDLPQPSAIVDSSGTNVAVRGNLRLDYGFYETLDQRVNVNLKKSRKPVKVPGFQWSYTGSKADLTAPGILAHEIGHHVHTIMGSSYDRRLRGPIVDFVAAIEHESKVSSYEPNPYESWAEAMRLFVLNPSLLACGRPKRYGFFLSLSIVPIVNVSWQEILINAHPRLIKSINSWIANNEC